MKILIAGGGSGGHIFPAYALIYELQQKDKEIDFVFIISNRSEERKIMGYLKGKLSRFRIRISPLIPLRGKDIFARVDFIARLFWGGIYSFLLVLTERPGIVVGFGGYLSGPLILAAFVLGRPTLIHEQNISPGRANLILSNFANRIALSFEDSKKYFKEERKLVVTGNPLRPDLAVMDKKDAVRKLGLNPELFTILVLGGSQGATVINKKWAGLLEDIKRKGLKLQFVHITGSKDFSWIMERYRDLKLPAKVFPFLKDIGLAYSCSDLVISRAGASTLNELSYFAKPVISIPYPYARGHQLLNAGYFSQRDALIVLEEKGLTSESLFNCICEVVKNKEERELLSKRIKTINFPPAAKSLAEEVWGLIHVS